MKISRRRAAVGKSHREGAKVLERGQVHIVVRVELNYGCVSERSGCHTVCREESVFNNDVTGAPGECIRGLNGGALEGLGPQKGEAHPDKWKDLQHTSAPIRNPKINAGLMHPKRVPYSSHLTFF